MSEQGAPAWRSWPHHPGVGEYLSVLVPSPTAPSRWFEPQQSTKPLESNAQVLEPPAVIAVTSTRAGTIGFGAVWFVVVPSPS